MNIPFALMNITAQIAMLGLFLLSNVLGDNIYCRTSWRYDFGVVTAHPWWKCVHSNGNCSIACAEDKYEDRW